MCEYDSSKSLCVYAGVFTSLSPSLFNLFTHSVSISFFRSTSYHPIMRTYESVKATV